MTLAREVLTADRSPVLLTMADCQREFISLPPAQQDVYFQNHHRTNHFLV